MVYQMSGDKAKALSDVSPKCILSCVRSDVLIHVLEELNSINPNTGNSFILILWKPWLFTKTFIVGFYIYNE